MQNLTAASFPTANLFTANFPRTIVNHHKIGLELIRTDWFELTADERLNILKQVHSRQIKLVACQVTDFT